MSTILIIEDSDVIRARVQEVLRNAGLATTFIVANDGLDGFKKLLSQPVDLVLCDVVMPGMDGYKFMLLKREREELRDVPVLMLTGQERAGERVRGLKAGASDYITKPFDDAELVARVEVHLNLKALRDELRAKNVELERLSQTDPLTGVANRRHLMDTLQRELNRATRYKNDLGLLMFDIDHFKKVNDRYGHLAGDAALIEVTRAVGQQLREQDLLGRFGGEEFVIILPQTNLPGTLAVAERCRQRVASSPFLCEGQAIPLTISLGAGATHGATPESLEALVRRVDEALMQAKEAGRNRAVATPRAE